MSTSMNSNNLYVGSLITSVIGVATLLFADYAAWTWWNQSIQIWGWIFFGSDILSTMFLAPAIVLLGFCGFVSFLGLTDRLEERFLKLGVLSGIASLGIQLGGFMLFAVIMIVEDNAWWPEIGFYGGVIGGALTLLLLYLADQQRTSLE